MLAGGDVDADIAQHLKRLTKRDAITRVKALQVLMWLQQPSSGCRQHALLG